MILNPAAEEKSPRTGESWYRSGVPTFWSLMAADVQPIHVPQKLRWSSGKTRDSVRIIHRNIQPTHPNAFVLEVVYPSQNQILA